MELEYISSDHHQIWFIRGHIDKEEAGEALKAKDVCFCDEFELPKHTYFRCRPDNTGEFDKWYYEVKEPGRGAFPVTMMLRNW